MITIPHIRVALLNFQDGGRNKSTGAIDFHKLHHAFSSLIEPPALIMFCEALNYDLDGKAGLLGAASTLSTEFERCYVGEMGWIDRGPYGPAIFYDPTLLELCHWYGRDRFRSRHNLAHFRIRDSNDSRTEFLALVQHWDYQSASTRFQEATYIDGYGKHELPVLVSGDLNITASGPHLPQRDWTAADYRACSHKGFRTEPDGPWVADTAAVDHLIGRWDVERGDRVDGSGFQALAELAWRAGMPAEDALRATVNDGVDAGGGLLIDWFLANKKMAGFFVPGSYQVHVPDAREPMPSDHRLVTATFDFRAS